MILDGRWNPGERTTLDAFQHEVIVLALDLEIVRRRLVLSGHGFERKRGVADVVGQAAREESRWLAGVGQTDRAVRFHLLACELNRPPVG